MSNSLESSDLSLQAVETARKREKSANFKFKFLDYKQSGSCTAMEDSSVSYAAGFLTF